MSKKSPMRPDLGSQHLFFSTLTSRAGPGIIYSVAATLNYCKVTTVPVPTYRIFLFTKVSNQWFSSPFGSQSSS